jgi:drug/metabolite transporter (DMT)-like permease
MLFAYAIAFSFAYLSLAAGTGALILFGAVQATMIVAGIAAGERPRARQWLGLVLALAGLAYLVSPGLAAPAPLGALLMGAAGVAWGLYSISGRRVVDPIAATASNFIRALPFALVLSLATGPARLSPRGFVLAAVSGAIASGLGYVIWYAALPRLTSTQAAVVQLAVPPLAALAAVAFLGEALTLRLVLCSGLILGGIAIAVTSRH